MPSRPPRHPGGTDDPYTAIAVFQQIIPGIVTAISRSGDANVPLDDAAGPDGSQHT
ncbi:hypothetical protein [Corynebacterium pseudodiphtheriticum]|uniref:hypothetical protein n=1 Tax=Corynebacterium pseudodiphtheriticum TaxID=37637 RepID=UPI0025411032|nr:hypothetical protein [Corynebacterium pseudodiphtheriticum]MDK4322355.1 hypothetical protein [Corynebacterium pseudodiphtheriticum]